MSKIKKKFYKISDDLDIAEIKKGNISLETMDFKNSEEKSIEDSKKITVKNYKNVFYTLITTSGKKINGRFYDEDSVENMSKTNTWHKPYNRPLIKHHASRNSDPLGRVILTYHIKHEDMSVTTNAKEPLPQDVIDYFGKIGAYDKGTGSLIAKCFCSDEEFTRIKDGLDLTVSQGIYVEKILCNICNKSIWECEHMPGENYDKDGKKIECTPVCSGKFEAAELSIVNVPANDTSVIYLPEQENSTQDSDAGVTEDKTLEIDKQKINDNNENNTTVEKTVENNTENKGEEDMYKELLKNTLSEKVENYFNKDCKESFEKLFDTLNEENLTVFIDFIENAKKSFNDKLEVVALSSEDLKNSEEQAETKEDEKTESSPEKTEDEEKKPEEKVEEKKEDKKEEVQEKVEDTVENEIKDLNKVEKTKQTEIKDCILKKISNL